MRNKKKSKALRLKAKEILDYDMVDTSSSVNLSKPLKFGSLGLKLPATPPTQVVSIRLPSELLNEIKAIGSQRDIPYQALIKLFLADSIAEFKKR